jgi:hypothetical protein
MEFDMSISSDDVLYTAPYPGAVARTLTASTTVAYYIFSPDAKWSQPLDVTAATETMPRRPLRGVVSRAEAWREAA